VLTFSQTADRIAATTKKLEKTAILADYLKSRGVEEAAVAAIFFAGRPFAMWEETTIQMGGRSLWRIVEDLSGRSDAELSAAYRKYGDLGDVAGAVLPKQEPWGGGRPRPPSEIQLAFREISAARGPASKAALVRKLLSEISPLEAKYIIKIMTGDLRIGLKESLVEEAIAKAFGAKLPAVQRANMLLGDIGETLRLAAEGKLSDAKMRLFHPIGFMLASPAESAEHALSFFQNGWVEDKYDGIRAQAHCSGDTVRFFSRTRDEITESFPELAEALAGLPQDAILDGEIVAWSYLSDNDPDPADLLTANSRTRSRLPGESWKSGASAPRQPSEMVAAFGPGRALPFSALQQRLGRKKVTDKLMQDVPVAYLAFDVLYAANELLIDHPLQERAKMLDALLKAERKIIHHRNTEAQGKLSFRKTLSATNEESRTTDDARPTTILPTVQIIRAPVFKASSPDELNSLFDAAQARGNEGLMIKNPESPYTPGRRGKSWLKLKRELATLDVVVTAVEYGHGRRIGVLSDYTFAIRDGERLLNIGKAYSGLTDAEILEMTKWFLDHTIADEGFRLLVEPKVVLEVAFNNMMKSDRHSSGYALRFPRIVRLRPDKLPEEADTIDRAQEIFKKQNSGRSKQISNGPSGGANGNDR
jgi:DNA ligase-1